MDPDFTERRPSRLAARLASAQAPGAADQHRDNETLTVDFDNSESASRSPNTPKAEQEFLDHVDNELPSPDKKSKEPWYGRIWAWVKDHRRLVLIVAAVLLVTIACGVSYALTRPDSPTTQASNAKKAPKPQPVVITSPLTGAVVSEEDSKRPVIGVMIENSTLARPQSGLAEAGIVFEAIAEYGITRFLALFQEANPANIGPVRSARPYYVDWARSFEASYAHVGGSPDALAKIKGEGVRDIDQFANSSSYRRVSSRDAPHNVYTTMDQLRQLTASKGWTSSTFTSLLRKKEAPVATEKITAKAVDIAISGPTYNVHFDYDRDNNSYLRTMAGVPHVDADSGARISSKVVIGLATAYSLMADGYHSNYTTTGTGAVKIFQDGVVYEGTWKREAANSQYQFFDAAGKPIALNPGKTWITVVGDPAAITYTP